jgi:hypothetical protein
MVNKREKTEGAKTAAITAPKRRTVTKPKAAAATRIAETEPAAKPAKKTTAIAPATVPANGSGNGTVNGSAPRTEDIAIRAYLIGEKRQQLGQPGDSLGDWVEAERQLIGERSN